MSDAKVQLYFDKDNKIRAFDPAKFERSDQLEKECGSFVSNISTFNEKVHSLVEVLEAHASRIDSQKLKVRVCLLYPVFSSLFMKCCHFVCRPLDFEWPWKMKLTIDTVRSVLFR